MRAQGEATHGEAFDALFEGRRGLNGVVGGWVHAL
jgi:hypothetical protein